MAIKGTADKRHDGISKNSAVIWLGAQQDGYRAAAAGRAHLVMERLALCGAAIHPAMPLR